MLSKLYFPPSQPHVGILTKTHKRYRELDSRFVLISHARCISSMAVTGQTTLECMSCACGKRSWNGQSKYPWYLHITGCSTIKTCNCKSHSSKYSHLSKSHLKSPQSLSQCSSTRPSFFNCSTTFLNLLYSKSSICPPMPVSTFIYNLQVFGINVKPMFNAVKRPSVSFFS